MQKLILILAMGATLISCKKESKCRTCGLEEWSPSFNQYIRGNKMEDFCGTDKEFKKYQELKKSQSINLINCSE